MRFALACTCGDHCTHEGAGFTTAHQTAVQTLELLRLPPECDEAGIEPKQITRAGMFVLQGGHDHTVIRLMQLARAAALEGVTVEWAA